MGSGAVSAKCHTGVKGRALSALSCHCQGHLVLCGREGPSPLQNALSGLVSTEGSGLGSPRSLSQGGFSSSSKEISSGRAGLPIPAPGQGLPPIPSLQCTADLGQGVSQSCPIQVQGHKWRHRQARWEPQVSFLSPFIQEWIKYIEILTATIWHPHLSPAFNFAPPLSSEGVVLSWL